MDCVPGEFEACRGDELIRCNTVGSDFDVVECPLGCNEAANGCVSCASDEQCSNPTPVCEVATGECRGCVVDVDCASEVCNVDTGACLAESEVVYAAPTGGAVAACSLVEPCSLARAAMLAAANPLRSTVRLLPGLYTTGVSLERGNSVTFVGTGATLEASTAFSIGAEADVAIRGLTMTLVNELRCDGDRTTGAPARATLTLRDVAIDINATGMVFNNCSVEIRRAVVTHTGTGSISLANRVELGIEKTRFVNPNRQQIQTWGTAGTNTAIRVVNSVFQDVGLGFSPQDPAPGQSSLFVAFNTMILANNPLSSTLACSGNAMVLIENNVIVRDAGSTRDSVEIQGSCVANNNIFSPQVAAVPGTNRIADPLFVNAAMRDLHLQTTSPAVDTAMPSTGLNPADDFEGVARPQGAKSDLGAFERVP